MKITSNVPAERFLSINGVPCIGIGDKIRVLLKAKDDRFPYSGNGYIGRVREIGSYWFSLSGFANELKIAFSDVYLLKRVPTPETFENTPYYDEAERQFWEDYWWTADGIARKTDEDKRKLKEFREQFE